MESHLFKKFDSECEKNILKCGGKAIGINDTKPIKPIKKRHATNEEYVVEKILDKKEHNERVSSILLKYKNGKVI